MSVTAAQLVTEVKAEGIDSAKSQLSEMGGFVNSIGSGFKSALGGALSLAAGLAGQALSFLKDQFVDSIRVAMDHQLVTAQTVQALKSTRDASGMTADAIDNLAASFSQMTPFSEDTVQQGENLLLTFTGIGKQVFPETTQAMIDMAQAMHQGPEQGAIMLGKALNDPLTGLTALTRVGVTFSDQEKKQIQTMMAHNDIIGAQKIMLHELETEFGGSAKAAGETFAGKLAILNNQWDVIKEKVGTAVLPLLSQLATMVTTNVVPVIEKFAGYLQSPAFQSFASSAGTSLIAAFQNIGTALSHVDWKSVISFFEQIGQKIASVDWGGIAQHIGQIAQGVGGFLHQMSGAVGSVDWGGIWNGIKQGASATWDILKQIGGFLAANFAPVWKQLVDLWNQQLVPLFKQMLPAFQAMLPILGLIAAVIAGVLVGAIAGAIKGIAGFLSGLIIVIQGVVQLLTGVIQVIGGILGFLTDLFTGHFDKLAGDLGMIWQGIINMFLGTWTIIAGIFQAAWYTVSGIVTGFVDGIKGFFVALYDDLIGHSIIPDMVNGIIDWIGQLPGRAMSFISDLVSKITGALSGLGSKALGWAGDMISGFVSGIRNGIGAVGDAIAGVADKVRQFLHFSKPDVGPLADVDTWMPDFTDMLSQGLLAGVPKLHTALGNLTAPIASSLSPGASSGGSSGSSVPYAFSSTAATAARAPAEASGGRPLILQVDGRTFAQVILPHIATQIRYSTGVMGR